GLSVDKAGSRVTSEALTALPSPFEALGGRVSRNIVWTLASDLVARGTSLGLTFFCARTLPVAGFGLFALTQNVAQYLWLFGDAFANSGYAAREVARAGRVYRWNRKRRRPNLARLIKYGASASPKHDGDALHTLVCERPRCGPLIHAPSEPARFGLVGQQQIQLSQARSGNRHPLPLRVMACVE